MASIQMLFIVGTFLILEYSDDNQFDVFSSKSFPKGSQIFNITQEQFALRLVFAHLKVPPGITGSVRRPKTDLRQIRSL